MRSAPRDKRLYLTGTAVSSLGDGAQGIAVLWSVYELHDDPALVGLIIAAAYAPALLLSPFLGALADRFDAKRATVASDLVRFTLIAALSVTFALLGDSDTRVWALFVSQVVVATVYTLFRATSQKMIRLTFETQDVRSVISLASSLSMAFTVAGAGLAGVILAHASPAWCFALNAVTFLVSAVCFSRLATGGGGRARRASQPNYWRELADGFRYVRRHSDVSLVLLLAIPSSGVLQGMNALTAPYAKTVLGGGPSMFAALDVAASLGGFISGLVLHRVGWAARHALRFSLLGMAAAALLLATVHAPWTAVVGFFSLGLFTLSHVVSTQTAANLVAPEHLVGRVVSIRLVVVSLAKIGFALMAGWLAKGFGADAGFLGFAVIAFTVFVLLGARNVSTEPAHTETEPTGLPDDGDRLPSAEGR